MSFFKNLFGGGTQSQEASLVEKHVEKAEAAPLELQGAPGEGPLYFALFDDGNSIEAAKNSFQALYDKFPGEVRALAGKPLAVVKTELQGLAASTQEASSGAGRMAA